MSIDINKHESDIEILKKQNVNDLLSIQEIYNKLKSIDEKIKHNDKISTRIIDNIKERYEKLERIIIEQNIQIKIKNLDKKIIFAKDFGISTNNSDNTEGFRKLQNYLNTHQVDEVLFEANSIIYTNINLKVKNTKLLGNGSKILPIADSWLFKNQKAIIILDDNSEASGFNFEGNYLNNTYEQDGKIFYSGASATTSLVKPIGVTGIWIIGNNCKAHHNTFNEMSWTCIDVNGKAKPSGRSKNVDIFDNIFYSSAEDQIAIHNVDDVRIYHNYLFDAGNHSIHPYSFTSNVKVYENTININSNNIIPWNEEYVENAQKTAIILDHPQYPQSDVFNIIIENNRISGNYKSGIEINGYADRYNIENNIFEGDNSNIGIRYKTISLGSSFIIKNKFLNLSKAFSFNTISIIAKPTYDVAILGSVLIENNEYNNCNIGYEMFATADIQGIEGFTFTCQNNKFINVSKHCNIQTLLTNFHLEMYDNIDMSKCTFNGNTLYSRNNTITTSKNKPINLIPNNYIVLDNSVRGFSARAKVNVGVTTLITIDEENNLTINLNNDGTQTSHTYVDYKFYNNPLKDSKLVTLCTKFKCENIGGNTIYLLMMINGLDGRTIKSVTPITKTDYINNDEFIQYNIFDISQYNLNLPEGTLLFRFQIGNGTTYGNFSDFKLLKLSVSDGINYGIDTIDKKIGYNDSKILFTKL